MHIKFTVDTSNTKIVMIFPSFSTEQAVIVDPKPVNVYDRLSGDSQSFTCHTRGSHSALSFYHNGVELKNGVSGIKIIGSTLTINHTSTKHTGMYQCITENERGSDGFSWFLSVRDPSEWSTVLSFMNNHKYIIEEI